jgi:hypothetical protein
VDQCCVARCHCTRDGETCCVAHVGHFRPRRTHTRRPLCDYERFGRSGNSHLVGAIPENLVSFIEGSFEPRSKAHADGSKGASLETKERNGPWIALAFWLGSPWRLIVMHQTTGATRRKSARTALSRPSEFGHHGINHCLARGLADFERILGLSSDRSGPCEPKPPREKSNLASASPGLQ